MIQKIRVQTEGSDVIKVYRLEGIGGKEAKVLAEKLLSESINQTYTINDTPKVKLIEIAYKPGVMNPEVGSILKAASDLGIKLKAADSSHEHVLEGKMPSYNPLTEHIVESDPQTLLIQGKPGKTQIVSIRNLSNAKLMDLSKDKLFLNLEEMHAIQDYFQKINRDPSDLELETLAQTWSEHSGHKTFKAKIVVDGKTKAPFIERIKKEALKHDKNIISAFSDNSGVMSFYDGFSICGKGETHNAPSSIEPYGGAMTGSGGVFRDILGTGLGAKNVISTDVFCFAPPDLPKKELPIGTLPPLYLLKKVVSGVRDYGNRVGIPTNNGSVHFHPDFRARPTVFVGAYGIMPTKYAQKGVPQLGDLIVVVGGRTGRDGIHGATFSSGEMTERTISVHSTAVQIGNAIEEKRVIDAILETRDKNLLRALQDCGGGGFSSAIGEVGSDLGVTINLEKAPLKYPGLSPWEIWISESQERMVVVIESKNLKQFEAICKKYNVESAVLGKFDGSKRLRVYFGKELAGDLDMEFLHEGLPRRVLQAKKPAAVIPESEASRESINNNKLLDPRLRGDDRVIGPKTENDWINVLEKVLSHGNVCSKEPIVRMYDHNVQGTSSLPPFAGVKQDAPNDAVVIRPLLEKKYGMIVSHGLNPVLNNIDPYWGSIWAGVEAISNYAAVGGNYEDASLIENFIWPFPNSESIWSLDRSVDSVVDLMKVFKIPVISGKDSLSSTYRGKDGEVIKIPPVLIMSVFGKIPDVSKTVSSDFKIVGSTIVLLGKQDLEGMGGSVYLDVNGIVGDNIPKVDLKILPKVLETLYKAIQTGQVLSVHDISEGGTITSIF